MATRWSIDPVCSGRYWWTIVGSPEVLIFLFFMITDPRTVPRGRRPRLAFGLLVGVLAGLFVAPMDTEFSTKVAILAALVVACSLRPLLESRLSEDRELRRIGAAPWIVGSVASTIAIVATLVVVGAPSTTALDGGVARVRSGLDPAALPTVTVDDEVAAITTGLSGPQAQRMLVDLADDLELTALAIERRNPSLLVGTGTGAWLDARRTEVADATSGAAVPIRRYTYDAARVVVVGDRLSPQSLPQLGLEVTGTERVDGGAPTSFSGTFTMTRRDGRYAVTADDRSGPIAAALPDNAESVPIELFQKAVRYGHNVDEGSQPDQEPLFDDVTSSFGIAIPTGSARL